MVCRKPFRKGLTGFGCGQCMPCRISRRRLWSHRILLESTLYEFNSFVTLTYNDVSLPLGGTLVKSDVQKFLKRLRFKLDDHKIRYFLVGEYGDESQRPHYHLALFNYPSCFTPRIAEINRVKGINCDCKSCSTISLLWTNTDTNASLGLISNDPLNKDTASYISGYVVKKLTTEDNDENTYFRKNNNLLLGNRIPEFALMSRRPGIGSRSMDAVAKALDNEYGYEFIDKTGDVPVAIMHGTRALPLGRYLRSQIRKGLGFQEIGSQKDAYEKYTQQVSSMFTETKNGIEKFNVKKWEEEKINNLQKCNNMETKYKLFKQRKKV